MEYTQKTLKVQEKLKKILEVVNDYAVNAESPDPYKIDKLLLCVIIETESALRMLEE